MKATIQSHYSTKRQMLYKIVPTEAPLALNIEPATFCNLKCNFCIYSCDKEEIDKHGSFFKFMSDETFELIYQQLREFKNPIKSISFIGTGEPLLHKKLPEMIARIKKNSLAERIIIVTNGTLLTKDLSTQLIEAGVDVIKISVNGLNGDDYEKNCGVRINFEKFMSQLDFLYKNRRDCEILIKTLTSVLEDRSEEDFYNIFGNVCDKISVERTMPFFSEIDYGDMVSEQTPASRYNDVQKPVKICAAPFIRAGIRVDGAVTLCGCRVGISTPNMDIRKNTLYGIWNGEEHKEVLLNVIKQKSEGITAECKGCTTLTEFAFEEDNLDPYAEEVYEKVLNMRTSNG